MDKNKYKEIFSRTVRNIQSPLIATVLGLLVGAVVIALCGHSPLVVYSAMFRKAFLEPYYLGSTLTRATPVIICAMATAMAWRAGYINIGVEGQMVTGTIVATVIGLYMPGPVWIVMPAAWIGGMIAGAVYAVVPAVLQLRFNASLIIVSLMMNYVANNITSYFVTYPLKDTQGDAVAIQTPALRDGLHLFRFTSKNTFNLGFIIAVLILAAMVFYTRKTVIGYESKMGGFNPNFARYGGVNQKRTMLLTMAMSGAIASFAGCAEVFGVNYRYVDGMLTSTNYAWTGLMAALIASLDPIGMFFVSIFLSGLQIGGGAIQRTMKIPVEIATIIQCCITLFVSVKLVFNIRHTRKTKKGENE